MEDAAKLERWYRNLHENINLTKAEKVDAVKYDLNDKIYNIVTPDSNIINNVVEYVTINNTTYSMADTGKTTFYRQFAVGGKAVVEVRSGSDIMFVDWVEDKEVSSKTQTKTILSANQSLVKVGRTTQAKTGGCGCGK